MAATIVSEAFLPLCILLQALIDVSCLTGFKSRQFSVLFFTALLPCRKYAHVDSFGIPSRTPAERFLCNDGTGTRSIPSATYSVFGFTVHACSSSRGQSLRHCARITCSSSRGQSLRTVFVLHRTSLTPSCAARPELPLGPCSDTLPARGHLLATLLR